MLYIIRVHKIIASRKERVSPQKLVALLCNSLCPLPSPGPDEMNASSEENQIRRANEKSLDAGEVRNGKK
jgi:hypothetical protein